MGNELTLALKFIRHSPTERLGVRGTRLLDERKLHQRLERRRVQHSGGVSERNQQLDFAQRVIGRTARNRVGQLEERATHEAKHRLELALRRRRQRMLRAPVAKRVEKQNMIKQSRRGRRGKKRNEKT